MLRKRPIHIGANGEFIEEYREVPKDFVLPEGHRIIEYQSPSNLGYRIDKILEEVQAVRTGKRAFSSTLANVLYLNIYWETAKAGIDEKGAYVIIGDRRFYSTFEVTKADGTTLKRSIDNTVLDVQIYDTLFKVNTLTVCALLFYNTNNYNPLEQSLTGLIVDPDEEITPENVVLSNDTPWRTNIISLLNALKLRNLLIKGYLTYYALISDETLGLSLEEAGVTQ